MAYILKFSISLMNDYAILKEKSLKVIVDGSITHLK